MPYLTHGNVGYASQSGHQDQQPLQARSATSKNSSSAVQMRLEWPFLTGLWGSSACVSTRLEGGLAAGKADTERSLAVSSVSFLQGSPSMGVLALHANIGGPDV